MLADVIAVHLVGIKTAMVKLVVRNAQKAGIKVTTVNLVVRNAHVVNFQESLVIPVVLVVQVDGKMASQGIAGVGSVFKLSHTYIISNLHKHATYFITPLPVFPRPLVRWSHHRCLMQHRVSCL